MADERDVVIRVRGEDEFTPTADKAADGLKDIAAAAGDMAKAAETAGADTEQAAQKIVDAYRPVIEAEKDVADQAKLVRDVVVDFADDQIAAIRNSGAPLELQKTQLEHISAELSEQANEFRALGTAAETELSTIAVVTGKVDAAMAEVVGEAQKVEHELLGVGDAGRTGFAEVDVAIAQGENAVIAFQTKLTNASNITGRDVGKITIAVENMRAAIVKAYGSLDAATPEALAALHKLEAELDTATGHANRLSNAVRDHNVKLKETGDRVGALGNAVAQLAAPFGTAGGVIAKVAGNLGSMSSGVESLKDAMGGLDGSMTGAGGAALKMGGSIALVIATFAAFTAGTLALEKEIGNNNEVLGEFITKLKELATWTKTTSVSVGTDLVHNFAALERSLQDIVGGFTAIGEAMSKLDWHTATQGIQQISDGVRDFVLTLSNGKAGLDSYHTAMDAGLPIQERVKAGLKDFTSVVQFHEKAIALGKDGQKLWNDAVKEGHGTAEGMLFSVKLLAPELGKLEAAHKTAAAATKDAAAAAKDHTTAMTAQKGQVELTQAQLKLLAAEVAKVNGVSLSSIGGEFDKLLAKAKTLIAAVKDLNAALERASSAGMGDSAPGISITNADGSPISPGSLGGGFGRPS